MTQNTARQGTRAGSSEATGTNSREITLSALLADAPKPDDHDRVREFLHALAAAGCAPLLVYPGAKTPFDGRTPRAKTAADRAAQKSAREAGTCNWTKVKSPAGVHLASSDQAVLDGYLGQYLTTFGDTAEVNVAVALERSALVVVDCDTAEQRAAFLASLGTAADTAPTVLTPGAQDLTTGQWVHRDGGHFWFTVPAGVELPDVGSFTDPDGGFAVMWGQRYVLTPPSVRAEGAYATVGRVWPLPARLHERIVAHGQAHAQRRQRAAQSAEADNSGSITAWGASIPWAQILDGTGWTTTGKADVCGCATWTAPGAHASPKSATAHEPGCAEWTESPDPPLHIWTDHDVAPFDGLGATVTRLRAVAAIDHGNDEGAAMDALGLDGEPVTLAGSLGTDERADHRTSDDTRRGRRLVVTWASEIEAAPVPWLWVDISTANAGLDPFTVDDIACVAPGRVWTAPEVETEGRVACGMVSIAAGREGSGKSSFGIWLTAKITLGTLPGAHYGTPKRVFYLATEDSWKHTLKPRLVAAGADPTKIARVEVRVKEEATVTISLPDDVDMLTQSIVDNDVALVVVDPLMSTLGSGLDANASRDVRTALEPLAAMADRTGAAVVAIAHFNKATGLDSLSRISGSGAFKDVARAVMVFADAGDERVFTQAKNSVGRTDLPSLNYEIRPAIVDTPTGKTSAGVFAFTDIADASVDDLLAQERSRKRPRSEAAEFIVGYIRAHADDKGEVDAADVLAAGEANGYARKQLTDARSRCTDPVISTRKEGFGKGATNRWSITAG